MKIETKYVAVTVAIADQDRRLKIHNFSFDRVLSPHYSTKIGKIIDILRGRIHQEWLVCFCGNKQKTRENQGTSLSTIKISGEKYTIFSFLPGIICLQ